MSYIKKDKHKVQPAIPVMSRIAVNGTITQFSVPPHLWKAKGDRAKGKSLEADRINRHLDNIRIRTVVMAISGLNRVSVLFLFLELVQSACPTSRRSAVQIRLFPQAEKPFGFVPEGFSVDIAAMPLNKKPDTCVSGFLL